MSTSIPYTLIILSSLGYAISQFLNPSFSRIITNVASLTSRRTHKHVQLRYLIEKENNTNDFPNTDFIWNFPNTSSVIVAEGQSLDQAQFECDDVLGMDEYCTIELTGIPSDLPMYIYRGKLKLTSADGVILKSPSNTIDNFVSITDNNLQFILIENLVIEGHTADVLTGIQVYGSGIRNVLIRKNTVYNFEGTSDALAIAISGDGSIANTDIHVDSNTIYDMRLGTSEAISIRGNVRKWAITSNNIQNVNNIAIDAIGGEGVVAPVSCFPSAIDVARQGYIQNNTVQRVSTSTNPGYGNIESWAAAIYIDGGSFIEISGNIVEDAPWAFEIGAENCVYTSEILLQFNSASGSYYGDLLIGGYAAGGFEDSNVNCNPLTSEDDEEGHGYVEKVTVLNNTFLSAGIEDNIFVQCRVTETVIIENGETLPFTVADFCE